MPVWAGGSTIYFKCRHDFNAQKRFEIRRKMPKNRKYLKRWRPVYPVFVELEYVWFDTLNDSFDLDIRENLGMIPTWRVIYCPFGKKTSLQNREIYTHDAITVCCSCHGCFAVCRNCFHASIDRYSGRDAIYDSPRYVWAPLFRFYGKTTFDHDTAQKAAQKLKQVNWTKLTPSFYQKKNEHLSIYKLGCLNCGLEGVCIF